MRHHRFSRHASIARYTYADIMACIQLTVAFLATMLYAAATGTVALDEAPRAVPPPR